MLVYRPKRRKREQTSSATSQVAAAANGIDFDQSNAFVCMNACVCVWLQLSFLELAPARCLRILLCELIRLYRAYYLAWTPPIFQPLSVASCNCAVPSGHLCRQQHIYFSSSSLPCDSDDASGCEMPRNVWIPYKTTNRWSTPPDHLGPLYGTSPPLVLSRTDDLVI